MKPRLQIKQKLTAFTNMYQIHSTDKAGESTGLAAYAQQKRLAFKEKVTFYTDESKSEIAFTFRAEKVMDIHSRYFVEDANGKMIGMFQKEFTKSLLNSTWKMMDANGKELIGVKESNATLAVARRVIGVVPYIGDVLELLTTLVKYHFVFYDLKTNKALGMYKKQTAFRDNYELSMTDKAYAKLDWRVFAAMGVGLDALQSR